jgi:hypothetical protein
MKKHTILGMVLLASTSVMAGSISVPVAYDNAKVLPKGVRNLRYNNVMAEANTKYDEFGNSVGVGDAFNVDVSYNKLIDGKDTALEKGILQGYLQRHGKDLNAVAGETTGVVNVEVDAQVPVFALGLTRKWTAAIVVPIVESKTNVDTGFLAGSEIQSIANQLISEGKGFKAEEVQQKTNNAIIDSVAKKGYKPLADEQKDMLGDIRIVNKLQLKNEKDYAISLTNSLVLPTGEEADIDKVVDVGAGDGQFDVEAGINVDFNMTSRVTVSARASYTWQIADTTAKRVPEKADSTVTPDVDYQVKRDLGDIIYTSIGAGYLMDSGIQLRGQYSFQYKEGDVYTGDKYESYRYDWMGQKTSQRLHAAQLGIGYSTIPAFKRKEFAVPLELNLSLGTPISGKNVTNDTTIAAEVAVFF